jgi:putative addiction module component (TIGR02574 family)
MQDAKLISLPLSERMHAMEVLWNSLSQGSQAQDMAPDWHKKTVLARVKKLKAGEDPTSSLEQTRKNIQKRIKSAQR